MVDIYRKILSFMLVLSLLSPAPANAEEIKLSAEASVLVHESGKVIYSKNADKKALVASLTKLMTALVVLENCSLDDELEIKDEYCLSEGSSMYLKAGESCTVEELLKGLLLVSGNDAAEALAYHTAGSIESFAQLMNRRAKELGMNNSHFENPHGLDSPHHYSTAEDMAKLMLCCMKNEKFREITALKSTVVGEKTLINHNRLLKLCSGCTGGKTGYTEAAGRCLVSSCEREGCMYVCVTLNAPDDWNDHIKLYNMAYSRYRQQDAAERLNFQVPLISGEKKSVTVKGEKTMMLLPSDAVLSVRAELPFFVFAPIEEGSTAGRAEVFYNGEKISEIRLFYAEPAESSGKA